jgi:hypothetical protein
MNTRLKPGENEIDLNGWLKEELTQIECTQIACDWFLAIQRCKYQGAGSV